MFFAFTGRETHAPGDANLIVNALPTLLTFLIVWFAIAAVGRVYRSDVIDQPPIGSAAHADRVAHRCADRHRHPRDHSEPHGYSLAICGGDDGLGRALLLVWHGGCAWFLARRV